jgi:hypothetical protein
MTQRPVLEPTVVDTIENYFRLLQAHASAETMLDEILTRDFRTGFVGGCRRRVKTDPLSTRGF